MNIKNQWVHRKKISTINNKTKAQYKVHNSEAHNLQRKIIGMIIIIKVVGKIEIKIKGYLN
jgi:hypothetical protein